MNVKFFKDINIFLDPIFADNHYYLIVINLTKNKGYVIDGLNQDQVYEDKKKIYMQRALALLLIYQQLKIPNFEFHVPTSYNIQTFTLKAFFHSSSKRCQIMWCHSYDGYISDIHSRGKYQQFL